MRWFAHFSKDEQSCWGETPPGSRTWTQFKERFCPALSPPVKGNEKHNAPPAIRNQPPLSTAF